MKRFLYALRFLCAPIILLWIMSASAQVPMTGAGKGAPGGGGGGYTGPGDLKTYAIWCGFRAFSAATTATKAIRVIRASDSAQSDINSLSNGDLDEATLATFLTSTTGKLVTCYDKVGTNDITMATDANRPAILLNCQGTHSCATSSGGTTQMTSSSTVTYSQPYSFTVVFYRTSGVALGQTYFSNVNSVFSSGGAFEFTSTAQQLDIFAGSTLTISSITENAFHCAQSVFNAGSSSITVDGGTPSSGAAGSQGPSATNYTLFNNPGGSQVVFGRFLEAGAETSSDSTGTVCSNAKTYWGY